VPAAQRIDNGIHHRGQRACTADLAIIRQDIVNVGPRAEVIRNLMAALPPMSAN
jgi:hypothetical protein